MKKRKPHTIPLPVQAVSILRALHGITGHLTHVFPDVTTDPSRWRWSRSPNALRLKWSGKKYSPHATRTTGSTRLNEMGFSADWIERQLAHADTNALRRATTMPNAWTTAAG